MTFTDSHCHLQDAAFAEDLRDVLERAEKFGIRRFVVNGTCPEDWPAVAALAEKYPEVLPQFGVHPWKVENLPEHWEEQLKRFLLQFPQAGLGEIGLDCKRTGTLISRQLTVFRQQIRLARKFQRPCTFHVIKAWEACGQVLREEVPHTFLMHSFGGSAEQVESLLDRDVYFSFGGALLRHPNSTKMQTALRAVPADRLLLETDAPYQHPQGLKTRQEPAGLLRIAEKVAEIREEPLAELLRNCEANAETLFGVGQGDWEHKP